MLTFVANAFSISQNSLELEVGDTAEIYCSNANSSITWSIDDNTVANLDKNSTANNEAVTVTALKAGSATITATSGGNNVACTVTVAEEQEVDLELASSILAGDTVYLACSYSKGQYNGPSNNGETAIGTYTEYTTLPNSNTYALEVCDGSENDTYAFKIKAGTYANYYLAWSSGNSLKVSDTLDSNSSWAVSFDGNKNVTITNAQDPARVIWWNVSYPRFSCYTGKTAGHSYKNVQLWKVVEEETPDQYFTSCTSIATLNGTESTSSQENTASVVFSEKGYTSGGVFTSVAIDSNVTLSAAKATSNYDPKYYNDGGLRVYGKNTMTITCDGTITEIVITYSGGDYTGASITCSTGTLNEDKTVWTGEASTVTFTNTSDSQTRIPSVSVTYNREALVVNDVFLRFGSTISKDDWNYIDETWGISDYGVMMAKETTLASYSVSSIKQAYLNKKYLSDFHRGSNVMPHPEVEEYKFTAKVTMTDEDNYDIVFCAAPYIVIDDEYYFLPEIRYSVNTLAQYYLTHGGSSLSEDALNLLKGN